MATQDWWDAVKHELSDMLVPRQAKRMATPPSGEALDVDRRQADNIPPTIYPPVLSAPSSTVSIDTNLVLAPTSTASPTTTPTPLVAATTTTPPARTTSARPTATADSNGNDSGDSGEMSVAAKAGIVIGVLGGILVVFLIVYLIVSARRRKLERRRQQIEDDEKINGPFADSAAIRPTPAPNKAPRLSLRPVTQFLPNFNSQSQAERRASRGIALTLNPVSNSSPLTRPNNGGSAWERPTLRSTMASPSGDHPRNPFHDKHELPDEPVSPISSMGSFDHRVGMATTTDSIPEPVSPIIGDDDDDDGNSHDRRQLAAGASSNLTRKTSMRKDIPKPLDLTKPPSPLYAVPPSPAGTEYSMHSIAPGQSPVPSASAAAIAAAGGPTQSTVHRVQLDFKPTLQDEMELRAGQLVRLLHEYDDGWALCIRLDRSQQGVVPRTCLSTRPVKPRPQQGPPGPQGNPRGGPPVNPSFHFHDRPDSHNMFPPVPVAKDERWGNGSGNRNGNGNGRRSPAGGRGQGRGPAGTQQESSGQRQWWRDEEDEQGGAGAGVGGLSPAPGQAY